MSCLTVMIFGKRPRRLADELPADIPRPGAFTIICGRGSDNYRRAEPADGNKAAVMPSDNRLMSGWNPHVPLARGNVRKNVHKMGPGPGRPPLRPSRPGRAGVHLRNGWRHFHFQLHRPFVCYREVTPADQQRPPWRRARHPPGCAGPTLKMWVCAIGPWDSRDCWCRWPGSAATTSAAGSTWTGHERWWTRPSMPGSPCWTRRTHMAGAADRSAPSVRSWGRAATRWSWPRSSAAGAWTWAQPGCSSVIAGATSAEQVKANAAAAEWTPTPAELAEIDAIAPPPEVP